MARHLLCEVLLISCNQEPSQERRQRRWGLASGVDAFGQLAAAEHQPARAARLMGAAEALHEALHIPVPYCSRADHDRAVAAARAALGEEAFAAAWAEGRAMTLEQAIAFALQETGAA